MTLSSSVLSVNSADQIEGGWIDLMTSMVVLHFLLRHSSEMITIIWCALHNGYLALESMLNICFLMSTKPGIFKLDARGRVYCFHAIGTGFLHVKVPASIQYWSTRVVS